MAHHVQVDVPFVSVRQIEKVYGGVHALKGVSLDFHRGSIHALIGENGAGKSTLVKIIAGAVPTDRGAIYVNGTAVRPGNLHDALDRGITMISQERSIVPHRSVLENVFLGRRGGFGLTSERDWLRRFEELTQRIGFTDLPPRQSAGSLASARQQQVEIIRALAIDARMIIMDEPTAGLTRHEADQLLALARRLAADGTCIVFVSHLIEEVLSISDTISVLRDGQLVITTTPDAVTPAVLVSHMVGRSVDTLYPEPPPVPADSPVVLKAAHLRRKGAVSSVSIEIRRGEIVGFAGLVGSGRSEAARLIFGADPADDGEVTVGDQKLRLRSPLEAMSAGIAMIPEARREQGLLMTRSVRENVSLASLSRIVRLGFVRRRREQDLVTEMMTALDLRGGGIEREVRTFSGGNQQKVLFARWLMRSPAVLIADEPTRGIDIGAKVQIHRLLCRLASEGMAVLLISSEIEEVMALSHRLYVFRHGAIVAHFERGSASREEVLTAAVADPNGQAVH